MFLILLVDICVGGISKMTTFILKLCYLYDTSSYYFSYGSIINQPTVQISNTYEMTIALLQDFENDNLQDYRSIYFLIVTKYFHKIILGNDGFLRGQRKVMENNLI